MIKDNDTLTKARTVTSSQIVKRTHSWEIDDPEERTKAGIGALHELETISIPPADAAHRDFLGAELFSFLLFQFIREERLSEEDVALWRSIPRHTPAEDRKTQDRKALKIEGDFDTFLMGQFRNWGWRMLISNAVLERLAQSEADVALVGLFSKNLLRRAKLLRHESGGRAQISGNDIRRIEERLLPDLRILFRRVRDDFGKRQSDRTNAKLAAFLKKEVEDHPRNYPAAYDNLPNLLGSISAREREFASRVRSGAIRPERFLHWLLEKTTGYEWRQLRRFKKDETGRLTY